MAMTHYEFLITIDELCKRLHALSGSKGEEYRGAEDNQFGNFERGSADTGCSREQVLWVYLSKHLDSIKTWIRDEAAGVQRARSEPIAGRIDDAILYLLLLRGMATECKAPRVPGCVVGQGGPLLNVKGYRNVLLIPEEASEPTKAPDPLKVIVCGYQGGVREPHPGHEDGYGYMFVEDVAGLRQIPAFADVWVWGREQGHGADYDRILAVEVKNLAFGRLDWKVRYGGSVVDLGR